MILSKLATTLVLAATSAAHAADQPPSALRGQATAAVEVESDCDDGYNDGRNTLERHWRNNLNRNCDNAWQLRDDAEDIKDDNYPDDGNWRTQAYNECARQGVDEAVQAIEKDCFEDSPDQCIDLGDAAAELVVMNNWCSPGSHAYGASDEPDWRAECKDVAVDICEGEIRRVAERWCPDKNMATSDLRGMQDECADQVDGMVGDDTDRDGRGECGRRDVDDDRPRPVRNGERFRFNLVADNSKCADRKSNLYEWGSFENVKEFSHCADKCVNDVRASLLDGFRGYDWDCYDQTCHCLYHQGVLDSRNSADFDRANRNEVGEGSIERTVKSTDFYCASLVGAEVLGDELAEIA